MRRAATSPWPDATLLDHTMVLFGSNLGNGNKHNTKSLPILITGGGFKHGRNVAFDRTLALPKPVRHWSLRTLREKLIKIAAS